MGDVKQIEEIRKDSKRPLNELPVISLKTSVTEKPQFFLLDSGATVNILHERNIARGVKLEPPRVLLKTLGSRIPVVGQQRNVQLLHQDAAIANTDFAVVVGTMDLFDGILGLPFLQSVGSRLSFETNELLTSNH